MSDVSNRRKYITKGERLLLEIQDGLNSKYNDFEQALHRRMMIREMKVGAQKKANFLSVLSKKNL